ncbi:hypothetical protein EON65_04305 [archaeon]|nr:MAG: hypothetical protein EON65_04305 [archaeon]
MASCAYWDRATSKINQSLFLDEMEKELLYWSRWNYAVASFCQDAALEETSTVSLIELLSGEGKLKFDPTATDCYCLGNVS